LEEIDWRPLPQANSINMVVRHLRIEAEWHVASLEHSEPLPVPVTEHVQSLIDAVQLDFERNLNELERLYNRFTKVLGEMPPAMLRQRSKLVYQSFSEEHPPHLLSFHQALHLVVTLGTNLYNSQLVSEDPRRPGTFLSR
jgi:hypothetical protein